MALQLFSGQKQFAESVSALHQHTELKTKTGCGIIVPHQEEKIANIFMQWHEMEVNTLMRGTMKDSQNNCCLWWGFGIPESQGKRECLLISSTFAIHVECITERCFPSSLRSGKPIIIEMFGFPLKSMKLLILGGNGKISFKYAPGRSLLPGTALNAMVFF